MTDPKKDTIYIDIDDEITSIIDKLKSSPKKIVALVLPKRATAMQSIVNMKLLKRSAEQAGKQLVLITSESVLIPLAGAAGIHVASTLQSKPAVPPPPAVLNADDQEESGNETEAEPIDKNKPIGELAGVGSEETIEVDNEPEPKPSKSSKGKSKKNKSLKIPNFNKFRLRLIIGATALILLIVFWYLAASVLPTAAVKITTDTQNQEISIGFISNPALPEFDPATNSLPAAVKELKKTEAQKAPATGQKNVGEKAKGTVKLINCNQSDKLADKVRTVPAGTAVSANGLNFILSESVEVEPSSYIGGECQKNKKSDPADVIAQNAGHQYNLGATTYKVAGFASITGEGSDMSGGTDNLVKVVSKDDVDKLVQKITQEFTDSAKQELQQQLAAEGLISLGDTFVVGEPVTVSTPNVDQEANEVTVSVTMIFTMQGVKEEPLTNLIDESLVDKIDKSKQKVLDYGIESAIFQINERMENGSVSYSLRTVVVIGPDINEDELKQTVIGKKEGEARNILENLPGVKEADVKYSPFWVTKMPKNTDKIDFQIEGISSENGGEEQ